MLDERSEEPVACLGLDPLGDRPEGGLLGQGLPAAVPVGHVDGTGYHPPKAGVERSGAKQPPVSGIEWARIEGV